MTADKIEREVLIDAPVDRVWPLVTEPGWWVGTETRLAPMDAGETAVKHAPEYGDFPVRVESVRPREYVAYRWASAFPNQELRDDNSTLVEFTLAAEGGKTRLRVVESGFASLAGPVEVRDEAVQDNTHGWGAELDRFRGLAEKSAA
ncbi:MAG TPA: SRPBCC domain-containing protein [Streptosporangiales bacterium]